MAFLDSGGSMVRSLCVDTKTVYWTLVQYWCPNGKNTFDPAGYLSWGTQDASSNHFFWSRPSSPLFTKYVTKF